MEGRHRGNLCIKWVRISLNTRCSASKDIERYRKREASITSMHHMKVSSIRATFRLCTSYPEQMPRHNQILSYKASQITNTHICSHMYFRKNRKHTCMHRYNLSPSARRPWAVRGPKAPWYRLDLRQYRQQRLPEVGSIDTQVIAVRAQQANHRDMQICFHN